MQKHISFSRKSFRQSSDKTQLYKPKTPLESSEDLPKTQLEHEHVKQWEEARCPICMEHPHNAVLLSCSSYDKGCRPYMCNTSYRHSNCLDQFCKSSISSPSTLTVQGIQGIPSISMNSHRIGQINIYEGESEDKLTCPLCRGEIYGWFVVEPARKFMNSQSRSCSYETCNFSGNYSELRKHARSEHPTVRPSEVDPDRQHDWTRLERETDFSDMVSMMQSVNGGEEEEEELEGISSLDALQSPYNLIVSFMQIIEVTMVNMLRRNDDTNNVHNDRQNNNSRQMENSDINRQNNFTQSNSSRSNPWEQMPHNQNNRRHNSFNNNLNYRQNNSFRGNLTERMRQRRINNIRSNRWGQQTNNVRRNRLDHQPNNVRRNYWTEQ